MTTPVEIRQIPPTRLLTRKVTCAHDDIGPAFGRTIPAVGRCLRASGAAMASEPIAFYLAWRESDCDIAVGCQVEGHVELTGGCEWSDLPAGPAACASHFGPYTSLKETHDAIHAWCRANGHQLTGLSWEAYPTDPGQEPDPAKWQTNVFYALKS